MSDRDGLLRSIKAVYAAAGDDACWPDALKAATTLIGGIGATFEVIDKATYRPREWRGWGIPESSELQYLAHYAPLSPRIPAGIRLAAGAIHYDHLVLDDAELDRDPFYAEFLRPHGFRYFIGTNVLQSGRELAAFAIQRSPKHGHVGRREIALMRALAPHLQQAHDMAARLKGTERRASAFERALDWLTDGAALLRRDGRVLYCNQAFDAIVRRNDGVQIVKGAIEFAAPQAHARFAAALDGIGRLSGGDPDERPHADFPAIRTEDAPAYVVSLRPLIGARLDRQHHDAIAIMFVRDPLGRNPAAGRMLRELFHFTAAEANLALAIQAGLSLSEYARQAGVSLNTVYTHLRRIKDKTGCPRMASLNRLLRELQVPLRRE
jgi:DNA-binding CsgD family transcriptional regulator/PAS domain-containing protein